MELLSLDVCFCGVRIGFSWFGVLVLYAVEGMTGLYVTIGGCVCLLSWLSVMLYSVGIREKLVVGLV